MSRTVRIVCAKAPPHVETVAAMSYTHGGFFRRYWRCSWCGARVKVIA